MDFAVDVSEIIALARSCERAAPVVDQEMMTAGRQSGFLMQSQSRIEAPIKDGHLRAAISAPTVERVGLGVRVEVVSHAEYSRAVHDGRRAATIVPVNRKVLRFVSGGETIFTRIVHQPARKGNPFFTRAMAKAKGRIDGFFADATKHAVRRIFGAA